MSKESDLMKLLNKDFKKSLKVVTEMDLIHDNLHMFATLQGILVWATEEAIIRHIDEELTERLKNA